MRQPTLRQIEAFKALVESGTVSNAAKALNVSQPAVSKLLTHLEEDVGFALFERGRGRIRVTGRGMRLYDEIDRVFSGVNQISQAIEEIRKEAGGRLQVGVMPGISSRFLAATASQICEEFPDLQIALAFHSSEFISDALLAQRFDLGIITQAIDSPHFETKVIDERPLVAVLPKGHRLEAADEISVKDFDNEAFVAFTQQSQTGRIMAEGMANYGVTPKIAIEATTAQTVCECVAAGMGVAVMSPIFVTEFLPNIQVKPLKENMVVPILATRLSLGRMSEYVDRFVAILRDESLSV